MNKILKACLILSAFVLLSGCSKKSDMEPVSIGNIEFEYDTKVWKFINSTTTNDPLKFEDAKGNVLSLYVSQESTYQHPMEMIKFMESLVSSSEEYNVFLEPNMIDVNGTPWYEFGYSYKDGDTVRKIYQRYYGKYYNAASVSYTSTEQNYDSGYEEAIKVMSAFKTEDVSNEKNEAKAHEFLVGEWDVAGSGYLVLKDDGTYEWYKDAQMDKNNMHYGTFGCDVENQTMSLNEGDGVYLVLFPEGLIVNGTAETMSTYKIDYLISFEQKEDSGYQMVNMSTYSLYTLSKVK